MQDEAGAGILPLRAADERNRRPEPPWRTGALRRLAANKNKLQLQKQTWAWKPTPAPAGAPPVFGQNIGTQVKSEPDTPRSGGAGGKAWRDQLNHLHPAIKSFMVPFHEAFEGRVMLRRMLDACGLDKKKLPVMNEFINQENKRNMLCYNHVLGICPHGKDCIFLHVPGSQVSNVFANELCRDISPGIDFLMKTVTLEDVKKEAKSNKRQGAGKGAGSPPNKQFKPGV